MMWLELGNHVRGEPAPISRLPVGVGHRRGESACSVRGLITE